MSSNMSLTDTLVASVVIPVYNRKQILKKVLNSLFVQDFPDEQFEIIVIDDGSTDGSGEMVMSMVDSMPEHKRHLRYCWQERKGPAVARNQGIRMARGRLVIFIDSDLIVCPEFVRIHVNAHTEDNFIVHGPVIHTTDLDNPTSARYKITDIARAFCHRECFNKRMRLFKQVCLMRISKSMVGKIWKWASGYAGLTWWL